MKLFDPRAALQHQNRARKNFQNYSFLFDHIRNELIARLEDVKKTFHRPLNLSPYPLNYKGQHHFLLEQPLLFAEGSFDLILSCLYDHWVNDLRGHLKNVYNSLQEEGLFLSAFWGGRTLYELRESLIQAELYLSGGAAPRLAPMLHPSDAPALLHHAGFFMPVVDTDIITVTYPSLNTLMKDLRGMGETNKLFARPKTFTSRALFKKAEEFYLNTFPQLNHHISATFEVIFLSGWKVNYPLTQKI